MVKCGICGQEFKAITWKHLKYKHGITIDEYRAMGHRCGNEKTCPVCGEMFVPECRDQKTCGLECGMEYREVPSGPDHPNWGKTFHHTEETKRKIRENHARHWQGKKRPNVGKKIAAKLKGRPNLALKGREFPGRVNEGSFEPGHEPWNKDKEMTPEYCENVSRAMHETGAIRYGPDNHAWKGGITPENLRARRSDEYAEWRTAVFERDEYTCQLCGQVGHQLVAHHIYLFSEFPDLRFDVDNGLTLCRSCHSSLHNDTNHPLRERLIVETS